MNKLMKWFKKNPKNPDYNLFLITINTNSEFLIRYPQKDYSPKIGECLSGTWSKKINVMKQKNLFLDIYVNNQKKIKDLRCEIKVEEFNEQNETINTSEFSFTVSEELEKIKWNRFEVNSVMD